MSAENNLVATRLDPETGATRPANGRKLVIGKGTASSAGLAENRSILLRAIQPLSQIQYFTTGLI